MGLKNTYQARKRFTKTPVKSTGMWYQDGDVVVPSNQITMKGPQGQPNYFNSPILGVGMQSGQQQVMQPGREYLFPNDQSVFETKMQNGGLFPVGPYDEMMAPKQGNYLLPDINRPSYIDDEGGRRSEYRTGVNIDGKETLLPTVVGARQLTDKQAEDQYIRTDLNMGKFNNVEDADYASRLRTARYNMLEDPIRFNQNQFQVGGETSTADNPTRMAPINISVQRPSWFERNIERPLENWGSSYAQRISNATGGKDWYKQSNPFPTMIGEMVNLPQLTATYAVTGKAQTPSEAMDIQNPYGAFAIDALLDPSSALAAGSRTLRGIGNFALDKLDRQLAKQINKNPKLALSLQNRRPIQSMDNVTISPGLQQGDVKSIGDYLTVGKSKPGDISEFDFFQGLNKGTESLSNSLRKRVEDLSSTEGFNRLVNQEREWLIEQGQDPSVAERVAKLNAKARIEELKNTTNINKDAFKYSEENFLTGLDNKFVKDKLLYDNAYFSPSYNLKWGESIEDKIKYIMSTENPNYSKPQPGGIAMGYNFVNNKPIEMHEIAHALQRNRALPIDNELRQITPKKQLRPTDQAPYNYFNTGSQGQEASAFANELRESMFQKGFIPDYYSPITETQVQDAYKYFKKNPIGVYDPKDGTFLSNTRIFDFMEPNKTNSKILTDVLNKLPAAAPIGAGIGVSQLQEKKYGGWLDQYQVGGETSTADNPVRMNPINVKGKMPKVNWYESIDPRNWGLRDYSTVDDYSTAYNRAKLSGQDEFYWKGKRYNTKYAGPINEEIATYGVKGQKVDPKDYITVYQYPYLDKDYLPSHIAADQSAQISKLAMSFSDSNWDKSKKFFDYFQTQIQPNTPYRTRSDEESLLHFPPVVNYGLRGNMQTIQNNMSLPNRKEYRVYGVDPVTFFKKSNNLDKEVYKDIGYNWNLITNNCADNVCDAFGVPRDRGITTPQDAVDKIKNKYPTLEVTGRSSQSVYKYGGLQQSYKKTKRFK